MIHIRKAKQYRVVVTGKNGEPLSVSEPLKTKQACWKNIRAQSKNFEHVSELKVYVKDETTVNPEVKLYNL